MSTGTGRVYTKGKFKGVRERVRENGESCIIPFYCKTPWRPHSNLCLCGEWAQDHIEEIIDGSDKEKKRRKGGATVESIKE